MAPLKPDGKGGVGQEIDDNVDAKVAGRSRHWIYTCLNDGVANYIPPDWTWFRCWRCGKVIYI